MFCYDSEERRRSPGSRAECAIDRQMGWRPRPRATLDAIAPTNGRGASDCSNVCTFIRPAACRQSSLLTLQSSRTSSK